MPERTDTDQVSPAKSDEARDKGLHGDPGELEPRPKLAEVSRAEPIVTDKGKRAEEKRREKWARQIASEAFKRR